MDTHLHNVFDSKNMAAYEKSERGTGDEGASIHQLSDKMSVHVNENSRRFDIFAHLYITGAWDARKVILD